MATDLVAARRLAATARALQPMLFEALTLVSDALSEELAERFYMVHWDRVRLIGQAQRTLLRLADRRFAADELGGLPGHVVERRALPLESIATAWGQLRMGRQVYVSADDGACTTAIDLLARMAKVIGEQHLVIGAPPSDVGAVAVDPAWSGPRVALVQPDADLETAAYVLARTSLRRTGFDVRAVHHAIVAAPVPRLQRVLRRIWVGARMGPVDDATVFAGPVSPPMADAYGEAIRAWSEHPGVETIVDGGVLERPDAGDQRVYLAPALFALSRSETGPTPRAVGPMLVIEAVEAETAETRLRAMAPVEHRCTVLRFGEAVRGVTLHEFDRQVRGALLVERLPPGLPDPRP